ncbi:PLDc N-terminal domain-containing protein [Aureibaculum sp. 2210JD6-5]|uniref:PLDc N-terminal domain-containing protein n=1 Tax=Aureibaculum sp. 2210JD6-5 TaxID=3103957 RepID=UPI0039F1B2D5
MNDSNALLLLAIIAFIWLLPLISIIFSRKTGGREKLAWILAVLFISWFAWIFYLLLAPIKKKN